LEKPCVFALPPFILFPLSQLRRLSAASGAFLFLGLYPFLWGRFILEVLQSPVLDRRNPPPVFPFPPMFPGRPFIDLSFFRCKDPVKIWPIERVFHLSVLFFFRLTPPFFCPPKSQTSGTLWTVPGLVCLSAFFSSLFFLERSGFFSRSPQICADLTLFSTFFPPWLFSSFLPWHYLSK